MTLPTINSSPANLRKLKKRFNTAIKEVLKPRPHIAGSDWANQHRVLSAETATEAGAYDWKRAPYQKEILDVCCDRTTQKVVLMTAARVGKTTILENVTGYYMALDPAPIMWLLPDLGEAEKFSTTNIDPMIRDTKVLRELVKDKRVRDSGNLKLTKRYRGGHISFVGAQSANALHGKTIRVLIADEVDRFPFSAGKDGDPLQLAMVRTTTFQNRRKIILSSTPVYKDLSHIEAEFLKSDQRYMYLPCPHCNHHQHLKWANLNYADDPENPTYVCENCSAAIEEKYKFSMMLKGHWVPHNPSSTTAGFHLNTLYSVHMSWKELAQEWQEAKGNRFKLQVFINSRLGETWDESGDRVTHHQLANRLEVYNAEVPTKDDHCNGVGILSAGVDIQKNRIEVGIWGYGANDETWLIDTVIFEGDTGTNEVWDACGKFLLTKTYKNKYNHPIGIRVIVVDSGYNTERAYRFVESLRKADSARRHIIATKGNDSFPRIISDRPNQSKQYGSSFYTIGTNLTKDHVSNMLNNSPDSQSYVHLPLSLPHDGVGERFLDKEILQQLTAEKVILTYKAGKPRREWRKIRDRNEQWDMFIMSYAGLLSLGRKVLDDLGGLAEQVSQLKGGEDTDSLAPTINTNVPTAQPFKVHNPKKPMNGLNRNIWGR